MSNMNLTKIMAQKFALELNGALAMENAGIERLQLRVQETSIPEVKQQMEHHILRQTLIVKYIQ